MPKSVSIAGLEDPDVTDDTAEVLLSAPSLTPVTVAVTVVDDDTLNLALTPSSLSLTEGAAGAFEVRLTQQPSGTVVVSLSVSDPNVISLDAASLSFDAGNWDLPRSVSVTALQDADAHDESAAVTVSAAGLVPRAVTVAVHDDDQQALVLDSGSVLLDEGTSGQVTVRLAADPEASVTVSIANSDAGALTVGAASLTFTSADYAQPKTVSLLALADADTRDENVTVTFSSAVAASQILAVAIHDDDVQSIVLSSTSLSVAEGGSGSVGVSLAFDPVTPLTVTAASSDGAAATAAPTSLTFTSANYAQAQSLTIAGIQDSDTRDESVTIDLVGSGTPGASIAVSVQDDDTQSLVLSTHAIALGEGGSKTFTVRLAFDPVTPVSVTLVSSDAGAAAVLPGSITFDSSNWAVARTLTVSAPQDVDVADESVTIAITGVGDRAGQRAGHGGRR